MLRIILFLGALLLAQSSAYAAWHEVKTRHFIIYANDDPRVLHDFATRLEKFDQGVRKVRGMIDPPLSDSGKVTIYVVGDMESIQEFLGVSAAAGLYIGRASGSLAFVPKISRRSGDIWEINSQIIFFHEYAHHLQLQNTTAVLPSWLVEGTAEFFSTARLEKDGSIRFGAPANHRAWSLYMHDGSLERMLGDSYDRRSGERTAEIYGHGWLLTHYLTFEPTRRGQLDRYVALMQQGQPPLDAARAAFGDLKQLDRDLGAYLKRRRLTTLVVDATQISAGPISIRPLRPGEAAIMRVRARSDRGVTSKTAPAVAAQAREVAARHPADPAVLTALAEAELDADNYPAAIAAADRALTLDPTARKATIFKGRALMELAREDRKKADWKAIRGLFASANRLDPDDAEALKLFYQSYTYSGERPTRNAAEGLLYAAALVPQDDNLRWLATQQLLVDKDLQKARQMYASIAFDPHADAESRQKSQQVMAAIAAGNADQALRLLRSDDDDAKDSSDLGKKTR